MNHQTAPILPYLQNQNNPTGKVQVQHKQLKNTLSAIHESNLDLLRANALGEFFYTQNGSVQPSDSSLYTCYKCGRDFPEFEPLQNHITNCTQSTQDEVLLLKEDHDAQVCF